ncbi:MAG: AAA family ATPase, partial [Lachnospiraceae bacterium]|nr:AAA family ATPase [Lachnospiraceae bacterium]
MRTTPMGIGSERCLRLQVSDSLEDDKNIQKKVGDVMGIYLNPGNENFQEVLRQQIYVDKSMMIRVINDIISGGNKYICMSRARRFGKTVAQNMLAAYYSKGCDSREMFLGLKIADDPTFNENLNKFNLIQIDMNNEYQNTENKDELIKKINRKIRNEFLTAFDDVDFSDDDTLAECILRVYSVKSQTFIILIDEYDVFVREQVSQKLFDEFLSFLNGLFKSNTLRPAISLAYITGILPIVRDKIQSKLNNFEEYTILDAGDFAEYVGFTSQEVEQLCSEYGMDYELCRRWYDGYSQNGYEIYNPESVVKSMQKHKYAGYWSKTSSYRVISDRMEQNFKGTKDDVVRMLAGERVDVNVTSYLNTMDSFETKDDVFTYLIHLGYLAYDEEEGTCRIPNSEVRQEWFNAVAINKDYEITDGIIRDSKALLNATING